MILPSTGTYELGLCPFNDNAPYRVYYGQVEFMMLSGAWTHSHSYHSMTTIQIYDWVNARLAEILTPQDIPAECSVMRKQLEAVAVADNLKEVEEALCAN